jgi:hypothetical protein
MIKTESTIKPASVARATVVRGGRYGLAKFVKHPMKRGYNTIESVSDIDPEHLTGINGVIESVERLALGSDAPTEGKESKWLTEYLKKGNNPVTAFAVVLIVGKGLSMLALTDPKIAVAVQDALRVGANVYYDYVAHNAKIRINRRDKQEYIPIDPTSLRAVGWLHSYNDAGDAQQHAHLLIGSTVFVQGDDCAHTIDSNDFICKVAKQAEDAVRAAMFETLCNRGLNVDPLSLDLAGDDKQAIKHLDGFSTIHTAVHEVQEQDLLHEGASRAARRAMFETLNRSEIDIDPLSFDLAGIDDQTLKYLERFSTMSAVIREAKAHGLSDKAAWRAARRAMSTNDKQPIAEHLRPLVEDVRKWASKKWTIQTDQGEIELRLSRLEYLESFLNVLSELPGGREAIIKWQDERSGGAFSEAAAQLERISKRNPWQGLTPAELLADYTRRLAAAAEAGQVLTRQSLESHALGIATVHPELSFERVNEFLQANFVEIPHRRGLAPVAELEDNIARILNNQQEQEKE